MYLCKEIDFICEPELRVSHDMFRGASYSHHGAEYVVVVEISAWTHTEFTAMKRWSGEALNASSLQIFRSGKCFIASLLWLFHRRLTLHLHYFLKSIIAGCFISVWRAGYTPGDRLTSWVYSTTFLQYLYISCYLSDNKPVLSYLLLGLLPQWWPRSGCTLCIVHCTIVHSPSHSHVGSHQR